MARRSMCATRSSTTAIVVESLEAKGAVFVDELDEVPDRSARRVLRPWRAEIGAGEADRRQPALARRHLPAGQQGASGGRAASRRRPPDRADRPCRPSRGDRHHGPAAAPARSTLVEIDGRCRGAGAAEGSRASPTSPRRPWPSTRRRPSSPCCGRRFPQIHGPRREDICYATTNRQQAVKSIAPANATPC